MNFFAAHAEENLFPDPSLLKRIDGDLYGEYKAALGKMDKSTQANGLTEQNRLALAKLLADHIDIFQTSFSSGTPAKVPSLNIDLTADAKPVKVRLLNHSH